jgi:hypothetical protein
MNAAAVAVAASVALASTAFAQPSLAPLAHNPPPVESLPRGELITYEKKDPSVAAQRSALWATAGLSLTVLGIATESPGLLLVGYGTTLIGPATGYWYADELGGYGLMIRGGATVVSLIGIGDLTTEFECEGDDAAARQCEADGDAAQERGKRLLFTGLIVFAGSALYDIYGAYNAAEDFNEKHFAVTPTPMGNSGAGLVFSGSW